MGTTVKEVKERVACTAWRERRNVEGPVALVQCRNLPVLPTKTPTNRLSAHQNAKHQQRRLKDWQAGVVCGILFHARAAQRSSMHAFSACVRVR